MSVITAGLFIEGSKTGKLKLCRIVVNRLLVTHVSRGEQLEVTSGLLQCLAYVHSERARADLLRHAAVHQRLCTEHNKDAPTSASGFRCISGGGPAEERGSWKQGSAPKAGGVLHASRPGSSWASTLCQTHRPSLFPWKSSWLVRECSIVSCRGTPYVRTARVTMVEMRCGWRNDVRLLCDAWCGDA